MTSEQARWLFVIQGDLFFGIALFLLFFVYFSNRLAKIYVSQGQLQESIQRMTEKLRGTEEDFYMKIDSQTKTVDTRMANARRLFAQAKKRERSARKLHDAAYKMLQRVRETKAEN